MESDRTIELAGLAWCGSWQKSSTCWAYARRAGCAQEQNASDADASRRSGGPEGAAGWRIFCDETLFERLRALRKRLADERACRRISSF